MKRRGISHNTFPPTKVGGFQKKEMIRMGAKEKGIIDLMNTQKVQKIDRQDLSNVF